MNLAAYLLALRRPALARERVRAADSFRSEIRPRLRKKDPSAPPPLTLSLNLTHLCNLRCGMCGQWRRHDTGKGEMLSLEELKRIADEVAPSRPKVYIWGGEPLLHPSLLPFLAHLKARKLYTVINTNGFLLDRFASEFVRIGVDSLDISLDGPPEVHDRVRGVNGAFDRLRSGGEKIREESRRQGRRRPLLKAVSVVTETSQGRLGEMIGLLERNSWFDIVIVNLGWFTSSEACRANEKAFADRLETSAASGKDFIGALGTVDPEQVKALRRRAARSRLAVVFRPDLPDSDLADYYRDPALPIRRRFCYAPWTLVDIRPDGSAVFCPDYPDYSIGNVRERPLLEIWNGDRARRFRRSLLERGLFPICSRCDGLYDFGF